MIVKIRVRLKLFFNSILGEIMDDKVSYKAVLVVRTSKIDVIQSSDIINKLRKMGFTVASNVFQEAAPFVLEINDDYQDWKY